MRFYTPLRNKINLKQLINLHSEVVSGVVKQMPIIWLFYIIVNDITSSSPMHIVEETSRVKAHRGDAKLEQVIY